MNKLSKVQKLKKILDVFSSLKTARDILSLIYNGYLYEVGWFNSFKLQSSVDANLQPIPWVTYPFIDFISSRLTSSMDIFEFGSGSSTSYYSKKVKSIVAVENNIEWYNKVTKELPSNATLKYVPITDTDLYCKSSSTINNKFDIIIVDGSEREECIYNCLSSLKQNGVVILDDAEREEYISAHHFMKTQGYKNLDFWGMAPGVVNKKCTTIFYKENNCLSI